VLFSNDQVAAFLNARFEPVWVMVRPVPVIRIDFGDGNVLTRTLHGNILTSVCTPDGQVLDSLPGIYEPRAYIDQLDQFRLLAQNFNLRTAEARDTWLRQYHKRQAEHIAKNQPVERFIEALRIAPVGKGRIERPTERLLASGLPGVQNPPNGRPFAVQVPPNGPPIGVAPPPAPPTGGAAEDLAGWKALAEDTQLNETTRRRQIHELLANTGLVKPDRVLKPIYKDVLHADLDDPYLGLGKVLFENYPFAKEDAQK
jgi:hypothetical protein